MKKKIHFIGIGGIGMSALARYFLSDGWGVSGSDLSPSLITSELKKEGAKIFIGHHSTTIRANGSITKVVYNQAIPSSNIELRTVHKLGLPCQSYPEAVGELTRKYKTIAIAGAHGKSTTTAMLSLILIEADFDPTVIVGTKLKEFTSPVIARIRQPAETKQSHKNSGGIAAPDAHRGRNDYGVNFRKGNSDWLVLEADEFGGAFWHYSPAVAVITNIDREHLDFYKNFTNVKKSFQRFAENVSSAGAIFTNKTYSDILENVRISAQKNSFSENNPIAKKIKNIIQIPGEHNVLNALAAYSVAKYLGVPQKTILRALSQYRGAWRRMEDRGVKSNQRSKVMVYDDYAHHPTEIKATLAAFGQKYPQNPLICVFQPHQEERLKLLFKSFTSAFKKADKVIILPTYRVAGRETRNEKLEVRKEENLSEKLAHDIGAVYVKNANQNLKKNLVALISNFSPLNSIVIMMGAGDIVKYTDELVT